MTTVPLIDRLLAGDTAAVARAVSVVENGRPGFEQLLADLHPRLGRARRIGITGPPGAGKSTLSLRLVSAWRARGERVAVVAVDPTSPFTGGALLGDRIRMEDVSLDPGVYIRSMATRGSLGGLATATAEVCDVLDAAGFDRILIETVGVGQSELDVAQLVDTAILALVPESGDGIQALKSGVMEIADLFVINKADRPGAPKVRREVELALDLRMGKAMRNIPAHHGAIKSGPRVVDRDTRWRPEVLLATAATGEGIDEIVAAIDRHWEAATSDGTIAGRRSERLVGRTKAAVERTVRDWLWRESPAPEIVAANHDAMIVGRTNPYEVAAEVLATIQEKVAR